MKNHILNDLRSWGSALSYLIGCGIGLLIVGLIFERQPKATDLIVCLILFALFEIISLRKELTKNI